MADTTEEKKHLPTLRKLQQLRTREGQVPRSKDFPSSFSLTVTIIYIMLNFGTIKQQIMAFFDIYDIIFKNVDEISLLGIFVSGISNVFSIVTPIFLIASMSYIAASILQTRGLVVSFKSITPKADKINPVEGVKRIFGRHGVSESLKIILKIILVSLAIYIILRWGLNSLFWSPTCEEACVLQTTIYMVVAIIIAVLIIYMIIGSIDIWISKILFMQDNKMTESELKRETKDELGSKELRQARGTLRREAAKNPAVRGFGKATVIVHNGQALVGLAYHPEKYDIPIVVGKQYGEEVKAILLEAKGKGVPVIDNLDYLNDLMKYTKVGEPVPQSLIMATAQNFLNYGIIER
jgi:type III secretion protein U